MDIKKWRLFADVADTGNFTKSGDRLGYTQSGVSHILKSLEKEVNFPLFIRSKKGVSLTPNAEALLPMARSLVSVYDNLQQQIEEINGLNKGTIFIGTFTSISIHWLPQIILEFQKNYPGIQIELMEGGTDEIIQWIREDRVDFGFLSKNNLSELEWIPLSKDPLVAILPKSAAIPKDGLFPISNLQNQNFIISARGTDYDIHQTLDQANVSPNIRFSSMDDHAIISMVAQGLGMSILPQLTIHGFEDQVSYYPLQPYSERELGIALKNNENLSPASQKFIQLTKDLL